MGSTNVLVSSPGKQPLFSFGVISDVQYADIPDGHSFIGAPRYYRHSILVLLRAVKKVNNEFQKFKGPVFHLIGNHCLYNLPRDKLLPLLKIPGLNGHAYYDFSPGPEYRIVVLDGYGISAIGWPRGHPKTLQALEFQEKKKVIVCCHLALDLCASSQEALLWNYDEVMN